MNCIDADAVRDDFVREIYRVLDADPTNDRANAIIDAFDSLPTIQQEQPNVDSDKLVNEEFSSHCRTTEYGLVATYNRDELYRLIKRMAIVFSARKQK